MTKKAVRLGLCGAGRWGKRYLETIKASPRVKIQGLFSSNPESKKLVPADCFVTHRWQELFQRPDLDGVILATPPGTHVEMALEALKWKLPCLVEKPLCLDVEQAQNFLSFVKKQACPVVVDHTLLFHPAYQELKKRLKNEIIEEIRSEGSNWGPFRPDYSALWDYGAHDVAFCIDLMRRTPEKFKTMAEAQSFIEGGRAGRYIMELAWAQGTKAFIKSSNVEKKKTRVLEVKTKTARFVFDDLAENPLVLHFDGKEEVLPFSPMKPLTRALGFFVEAIEGGISQNGLSWGLELSVETVKVLDRLEQAVAG